MNKIKIVTISGGTGGFTILKGLRQISEFEITSILPSTDSGGSTGRLRDEFGYLPMGDFRQALVALSDNDEDENTLRDLFLYRFDNGETGLKGHNVGNLLLTALTDMYGDELIAIEKVSKLLNVNGRILPITLNKCELVAEYENGSTLLGEHLIDEPPYPHDGRLKIVKLSIDRKVETYDAVRNAIMSADVILIGPGDLYTSILANLVIDDISKVICDSNAKLFYISPCYQVWPNIQVQSARSCERG